MANIGRVARDDPRFLYNGLQTVLNATVFRDAKRQVEDMAFEAIFTANESGVLTWVRTGDNFEDLTTEVEVSDARGRKMLISIFLFTSVSDCMTGFLMLCRKTDAPCRNTSDVRVQKLISQVTGEEWPCYI